MKVIAIQPEGNMNFCTKVYGQTLPMHFTQNHQYQPQAARGKVFCLVLTYFDLFLKTLTESNCRTSLFFHLLK